MSKTGQSAVIVEGFRTPFIFSGGDLQDMPAEDLGACLLKELVERSEIDSREIEEVILSNIVNSAEHSNIAYTIAVRAGLPRSVFAETVRRADISSLQSLFVSACKIQLSLKNTIVAGGVENMSQAPILIGPRLRKTIRKFTQSTTWKEKIKCALSFRPSDIKPQFADCKLLEDPLSGLSREHRAERLSEIFHISRARQDEFTLKSFEKTMQTLKNGKTKEEIAPLFPPADFPFVAKDKGPENKMSAHSLSRFEPFFKGNFGTVTAGNSAFSADGSAMLLVMNKEKAKALGCKTLVTIYSFARSGRECFGPAEPGLVHAVEQTLQGAGLTIRDIDLFEIDESFAVQALTVLKVLFAEKKHNGKTTVLEEPELAKCNVNGGALALGNPVSATPARMALSLAKEMKRRQVEWGLVVTTGIGSGQAGALLLKNE